jgi:cyanophycinase
MKGKTNKEERKEETLCSSCVPFFLLSLERFWERVMNKRCLDGFLLIVLLFIAPLLRAEDVKGESRIRPAGIDGALVIGGGGDLSQAVMDKFLTLGGGDKAKPVLLSTVRLPRHSLNVLMGLMEKQRSSSVLFVSTREQADDPMFLKPLEQATGVWMTDDAPASLLKSCLGTKLENQLRDVLRRGGVIGTNDGTAAILSTLAATGNDASAVKDKGLDLLPGSVVVPSLNKGNRQPLLTSILDKNPGLVGFGVDEGAALIVKGRELRGLGESKVTIFLGRSKTQEPKTSELKPGAVADLTALRRAAQDRANGVFPPAKVPAPEVPSGSLVIVGGGGMPAEVTKKFIDLAGGPEALIVTLPTANPDPLPMGPGESNMFLKAGAKNVQVLRARDVKDVEDPKTLDVLKNAKAIWFGGGRQWRFVDAYEQTKAEPLFREVLKRGGVIGGSSAGATIQGDYLCRGSPLGNLEIMYEGYERGFAFLPGVAIDQHFTQRKRFPDMTALMKKYPQYLGIGIDESTALIVQGHVAEIMGKNKAHFFDTKRKAENGKSDYESVTPGQKYDLKERKVIDR